MWYVMLSYVKQLFFVTTLSPGRQKKYGNKFRLNLMSHKNIVPIISKYAKSKTQPQAIIIVWGDMAFKKDVW